jgi:hypothetical protein
MMLVLALTYAAMAWALTKFGMRASLAALGAYVFAFGLPRLTQIGHQQLLPNMFAPLALVFLWRFLDTPSIARLAGVLVASYLQFLSSIYLGWFLILALVVFTVEFWLVAEGAGSKSADFLRRSWLPAMALLAFWGGLVFALASVYAEANQDFRRSYAEVRELIPRSTSWLASAPQAFWYDWLPKRWQEPNSELWLFPGALPLLSFIAAFFLFRREGGEFVVVKASLLTAAVLAVVAMRFGDWSAWYGLWKWTPGGHGIRAVGRIWTAVLLFALVGGMLAVEYCLRERRVRWIAPLLLVLGVLEHVPWRGELPSFDVAQWKADVEGVRVRMIPREPHYVGLKPSLSSYQGQLVAMWAGLKADLPVVNGYSGRYPFHYPDWTRTMTDVELQQWLAGKYSGSVTFIQP